MNSPTLPTAHTEGPLSIDVKKPGTTKRKYKVVIQEVYHREFAVEATSEADAQQIVESTKICDLEEIGETSGRLVMSYVSAVGRI